MTTSESLDEIQDQCRALAKEPTTQVDEAQLDSLEHFVEEYLNNADEMTSESFLPLWKRLKHEVHAIAWCLYALGLKSGDDAKVSSLDKTVKRQVINLLTYLMHFTECCDSVNAPGLFGPNPAVKDVELVLSKLKLDAYLKLRSTRGTSDYYTYFQNNGIPRDVENFLCEKVLAKYPGYVINLFVFNKVFIDFNSASRNPDHLLVICGLDKVYPEIPTQYRPLYIEECLNKLDDIEKGKIKRKVPGNGPPAGQGPSDGYNQPGPRYAPPAGYNAPGPHYGPPVAGYNAPGPQYGPPVAGYGQPGYSYGQFDESYNYWQGPGSGKAQRQNNSAQWKNDRVKRKAKKYGTGKHQPHHHSQDGYAEHAGHAVRHQDGREQNQPTTGRAQKQKKQGRNSNINSMFGITH